MQGFDEHCECLNIGSDEVLCHEDPDQDVTNKVNRQIRQAIADVLSGIVHDAIAQSLEDTISLDDGHFDFNMVGNNVKSIWSLWLYY